MKVEHAVEDIRQTPLDTRSPVKDLPYGTVFAWQSPTWAGDRCPIYIRLNPSGIKRARVLPDESPDAVPTLLCTSPTNSGWIAWFNPNELVTPVVGAVLSGTYPKDVV